MAASITKRQSTTGSYGSPDRKAHYHLRSCFINKKKRREKKERKSNLNLIKPLDLTPKFTGNTKKDIKPHHRKAVSKIQTLRNSVPFLHEINFNNEKKREGIYRLEEI